jgi:hypothetical protein
MNVNGSLAMPVEGFLSFALGRAEIYASILEEIKQVGVTNLRGTGFEFGHEMRKRRGFAFEVLCSVSIREEYESDTSGTQDPVNLGEEPNGLCQVLQEMTSDDEVLTTVIDSAQAIGVEVCNHIRLSECVVNLRKQPLAFQCVPTIHICDLNAGQWQLERVVARTQLDTGSDEIPSQ